VKKAGQRIATDLAFRIWVLFGLLSSYQVTIPFNRRARLSLSQGKADLLVRKPFPSYGTPFSTAISMTSRLRNPFADTPRHISTRVADSIRLGTE
jgi:hypothetical protein